MKNAADKPMDQGIFSVFSLNLRFGLANDGSNSWAFRKGLYPALLHRYVSDFMCFQEANDFQIDFLNRLLPDYGVIGKRSPAPEFWQNNVIFYHNRWTCVEKHHFFLSHSPDMPSRFRESRWPRQCTIGVFAAAGHDLICVNTHFDFDTAIQEKSAGIIMDKLAKWDQNIPVILVGDFNTDPSKVCYKTFTQDPLERESATANNPCTTPFSNSFSNPFPGTHHGFTGKSRGNHIDWILYKGPVKKKEAKIIEDDFGGSYPSDHFPLQASFAFDGCASSP